MSKLNQVQQPTTTRKEKIQTLLATHYPITLPAIYETAITLGNPKYVFAKPSATSGFPVPVTNLFGNRVVKSHGLIAESLFLVTTSGGGLFQPRKLVNAAARSFAISMLSPEFEVCHVVWNLFHWSGSLSLGFWI